VQTYGGASGTTGLPASCDKLRWQPPHSHSIVSCPCERLNFLDFLEVCAEFTVTSTAKLFRLLAIDPDGSYLENANLTRNRHHYAPSKPLAKFCGHVDLTEKMSIELVQIFCRNPILCVNSSADLLHLVSTEEIHSIRMRR